MNFKEPGSDIPTAKGSAKKANLAKDDKIKSFWDTLVNDWLKLRSRRERKTIPRIRSEAADILSQAHHRPLRRSLQGTYGR